jgi:beta-lactam-binding protein with PASTA domain
MVNVDIARSAQALADRQLTYTQIDQFDPLPVGTVISQSIPPMTEVPRGTSVELVVSKGPDVVPFPELAGLDYAGIESTLTTNGFVVGVVAGDRTQALQQVLINGQPATTGALFPRNSTVNLVYPEGAPPADTTPPA